jgi:hypothetical protein
MGHYEYTDNLYTAAKQQALQPSIFEMNVRDSRQELGSKAQQTEFKVERKLVKEARLKYQTFRIGQSEIRDLDRKKLLDLKNFKGKQPAQALEEAMVDQSIERLYLDDN